jgi:hypothetical protein
LAAERQPKSDWLWGTTVAVTLVVMEFILLSALVPTEWSNRVRDLEDRWLKDLMGAETAELVLTSARSWYGTVFIDTGLVQGSYELLLPDDASIRTTPELGKLAGSPLWPWVADRLDVVWQALYMAMQRTSLLLAWWPFFAFVLVGAAIDGLLRRSIRQSGFDYPSPLAHRLAVRGMLWLGFLVTLGLLAPLPVSPLAVPVIGTVAGMVLAVMVTQTQKRL